MENNNQIEKEVITENRPKLNLATSVLVAGLIIAGAILASRGGGELASNAPVDKLDLVSDISKDDLIRGDRNASITLIEYADFSCHYCAQYHDTLKDLVADRSNDVRWVYRNFPIFNPEAAIAGVCVGKLGGNDAFWDFSDKLYDNQDKFNSSYYLSMAEAEGINAVDFNKCINDPTLKNKSEQEFTQVRVLLGFNATPHTVIIDKNGRKFSFAGALSPDVLKSAITGLNR